MPRDDCTAGWGEKVIMGHLATDKTESAPDEGVGSTYPLTIEPINMIRLLIGPFDHKEKPKFKVSKRGVDPPKSFICQQDRLDQDDGFKILFLVQNYGTKTVKVTIRRVA